MWVRNLQMISQQENVKISSAGVGPGHCGEEIREGRETGQGGKVRLWDMLAGNQQTSTQQQSCGRRDGQEEVQGGNQLNFIVHCGNLEYFKITPQLLYLVIG